MRGFKHTGRGPKYGSFTFPSGAGFGPSSGSVKNVSGYTRRAPKRVMKKAIGGLATGEAPNTPGGPADFAKGGKVSGVKKLLSKGPKAQFSEKARKTRLAEEMERVGGLAGKEWQESKATIKRLQDSLDKKGSSKSSGFSRTPKIGK